VSARLALCDVHVRISSDDILAGVSLSLAAGEILALLGPSGSGKTTLVRVALGLVAPDRGSVLLDGERASGDGRILVAPEALGLTRQWAILERGRIVQQGGIAELRARPGSAFVRALLDDLGA